MCYTVNQLVVEVAVTGQVQSGDQMRKPLLLFCTIKYQGIKSRVAAHADTDYGLVYVPGLGQQDLLIAWLLRWVLRLTINLLNL